MKAINVAMMLTLCASSGLWYGAPPATLIEPQSVEETWVREFNPTSSTGLVTAAAIVTDKEGNVYVAGWKADAVSFPSRIIYDYVTIKYDSGGNAQWVANYSGPGGSNDKIEAIAVDDAGNVYVTGESEASDETTSCVTIKYNSNGSEQWVARYSGPGGNSSAKDIALDNKGNVYVTGKSKSSGFLPTGDYVTIKYDANGNEQWVARFSSRSFLLNEAWAIAVDAAGAVYVTGGGWGEDTSLDYTTIKYSPDGKEQWVARYNGPGNGVDIATSIAVDGSSNVYVTGFSTGASSSSDFATIKYDSSGVEQWARRFNGVKNAGDIAKDLAVDASGNVYVAGVINSRGGSPGSSDPDRDYATLKYSSDGNQEWVAVYDGPAKDADEALALAIDGSGNVYVTGQSVGSGSSFDYATVKYNGAGSEQWVMRYADANNRYDGASDIAVDGRGGVYVSGSSHIDDGGRAKIVTIKYAQRSSPGVGPLVNVSAASYSGSSCAVEGIVAAFGINLATTTQAAFSITLPTTLGGTTVQVKDSAGQVRLAPLFFVSPFHVNYLIPAGTANGTAEVTITSAAGAISKGTIQASLVAPGVFSANANGVGLAAGVVLRVRADGSQSYEPMIRFDPALNSFVAAPIDLGPESDQVFLLLFCTGVKARSSIAAATASLGGQAGQVSYVGNQGQFAGLDQVNVRLPRSLIGRGEVDCALVVDGLAANVVKVHVK
ncbi:MAG: SBBP repeat-containing protein [Blastocatellales bacterium]